MCSVGLTFDERLYPKPKDMTPDEEFNHYLDRYPAVKRQFEGAKTGPRVGLHRPAAVLLQAAPSAPAGA